MIDASDLRSPDPLRRDLAYLLFLEELLGPEWVERWARKRGKLDALREWRFQTVEGTQASTLTGC